MKIFIASNTSSAVKTLTSALEQLGMECLPSQVFSLDSADSALAAAADDELAVLFFVVADVGSERLVGIKNLCARGTANVKVIAVGSNFSPAMILQAVRAGAVDCLDIADNFEQDLADLLSRIKTTSAHGTRLGRLLTVIGPAGGSGASMVAANLAVLIARYQPGCALLDLHVRGGDISALLKCSPRYTLMSLAANSEQLDRAMFEQSLFKHESGVQLLASPEPLGDYRAIRPELIQRTVHLARGLFENVVVDLEDCEHPGQIQTLASSDAIIVVTRPDIVALYRTKRYLEFLTKSNVAREHIYLVANRIGQPKEVSLTQIESMLGLSVTQRLPDDPATVLSSVNLGVPLVLASPQSPISKGIAELANSLMGVNTPAVRPTWAKRQLCRLRSFAALIDIVHA